MFTICPSCSRQFRIYAEHIAAASGQVRCGFCHELFNALERLHDEPLESEKTPDNIQHVSNPSPEPENESEPQFDISGQDEPFLNDSESDILINNDEAEAKQELETAIDEIGIKADVVETNELKESDIFEEPELETEPKAEPHYEFTDPEEILEPEPVRKSRLLMVFWTTACIVGILVILLQLAWFNRDQVLVKYPQLTPYVKQACQELDCRLIRQRDASAIKLINRDVRLHPRFKETLLVNATMENQLSVRQPYPRVQLTLFDTSGALLGYRDFIPSDYLDSSIDIDEGMPVNSPVHFVLEVSGPTSGAVSFEFRFL